MKLLVGLILFKANLVFGCNFPSNSDLVSPEIVALSPVNCVSNEVSYGMKEFLCSCVEEENEKFNLNLSANTAPKDKIIFLEKLIEKKEIALLNITNDIASIDQTYPESNVGEKCFQKIDVTLKDFKCKNSHKNRMFSDNQISKISQVLLKKKKEETEFIFNKRDTSPLTNQKSFQCNQKEISQGFLKKINQKVGLSSIAIIRELISNLPREEIAKAETLSDLLGLFYQDKDLRGDLYNFTRSFPNDPILRGLLNSKDFLHSLQSNESLSSTKLQDFIKKEVENSVAEKCHSFSESLQQLLCTEKDQNLFPAEAQDFVDITENIQGQQTIENYLVTNGLAYDFCHKDTKNSVYSKISETLNRMLPRSLTSSGDLSKQTAANFFYTRTQKPLNDAVCEYLPPPKSKYDDLKTKINECNASDGVYSYDCMLAINLHTMLEPEMQEQKKRFRSKLASSLKRKKLSITEAEIEKEFLAKWPERAEKINITELTEKVNTYGTVAKDFLGIKDDSKVVDEASSRTNESIQSQSQVLTGTTPSQSTLASGKLSNSTSTSSERQIAQQPAPAQDKMEEFYQEVMRRISKNRPAQATQISETSPKVPSYLAPAFDVPVPDQTYEPSFRAPATANISAENYFDEPNQLFPGRIDEATMVAATSPSEVEQRNKALNETVNRKLNQQINATSVAKASPISITNFSDSGLATEIPELIIGEELDSALAAISSVDNEQARLLYELLTSNKNSFYIVDRKNPANKVQVKKTAKGFEVIPLGNEAEINFIQFVASIKRSINLQDNFETILEKLSQVIKK